MNSLAAVRTRYAALHQLARAGLIGYRWVQSVLGYWWLRNDALGTALAVACDWGWVVFSQAVEQPDIGERWGDPLWTLASGPESGFVGARAASICMAKLGQIDPFDAARFEPVFCDIQSGPQEIEIIDAKCRILNWSIGADGEQHYMIPMPGESVGDYEHRLAQRFPASKLRSNGWRLVAVDVDYRLYVFNPDTHRLIAEFILSLFVAGADGRHSKKILLNNYYEINQGGLRNCDIRLID